jgi:hypothetical protein
VNSTVTDPLMLLPVWVSCIVLVLVPTADASHVPVNVRTVTDISERADWRESLTVTTTAKVPAAA